MDPRQNVTGFHTPSDKTARRSETGRGSLRAAALVACVALQAVGCGTALPAASLDSVQIASVHEADRILNSTLTPEEQALLINAHGAVVEDCMQQLGWDFKVGVATPELADGGPRPISRFEQWAFADATSAESEGFGLESYVAQRAAFIDQLESGSDRARIPDQSKMTPEDSQRYQLDYFGRDDERVEIVERDGSRASVPGGGCLGTAERAIFDDIEQELRLQDARTTAQSEIWGRTLADPTVASSLATWKGCMKDRGLEFDDPEAAFGSALDAALAHDRERERVVATAAAQCTKQSGLAKAVEVAFLAATNATLPDLEDDLVSFQQFEKEALARAKAILRFGN